MPRIGHNPARFVEKVDQPAGITVAVVNFIPFLGGYYAQSLDVLKACLTSIHANTPEAHDLMVFDNHSCREVRDYLLEAHAQGVIQYLILSEKNIGKIGAWNFMFGAAQGKYIAFSDSDVLHKPGWLTASLDLFAAFPNVGMVTGRPYRTIMEFSAHSLEWARQQPAEVLEEGPWLDWDVFLEHYLSLGHPEEQAREEYAKATDYRVTRNGQCAFLGANHFQMVVPAAVLKKVMPLESKQPMRGEHAFDIAVDKLGYLRLSTEKAYVTHMGNSLPADASVAVAAPKRKSLLRRILWLPGIRHFLLWLNNRIFRLYFFNAD